MSSSLFLPPTRVSASAHVKSMEQFRQMHAKSVDKPAEFWAEIAEDFYWKEKPKKDKFLEFNLDYSKGPVSISWMGGARTNMCYNAVDRHVEAGFGDRVAFHWAGNDLSDTQDVKFKQLKTEVCKLSNALRSLGVAKGDRVAIYMPMIPQLPVALLACARIGAIHSVVFGGYSANALAERMVDGGAKVILTADGTWRGEKLLNLKEIVDKAMLICREKELVVTSCLVVNHLGILDEKQKASHTDVTGHRPCSALSTKMISGRDVWWHEIMKDAASDCPVEWFDSETPLFMLYTSGSTGKPKGVLHTTAGYMMYAATTFKYVFDFHDDDVYFCTADIGWITGHSYVVYGPLLNGATGVIFEGVPFFPDPGRFWHICAKYKVTKFYTAPTAIRALMKFGNEWVHKHDLAALKVLGSVGEPINPEAWLWYHKIVGGEKCAIVDTFWQTETGGHVLTPLPGATPTKPGSCAFPFFGVTPKILSEDGKEIVGEGEGYLVFSQPWPGIMRTVYGNHQRFETTYFKKFPGYYCTGDGARRDADGYLWVTGRIDDMMNCSGHLMSTAEMESVLVEHEDVAEAAVVAKPHPVKGECAYAFVTLKEGRNFDANLVKKLNQLVRARIGPLAMPDFVQHAPQLPKTRSGKIMRRVLRKITVNDRDLGDISTLADESVVELLFNLRLE